MKMWIAVALIAISGGAAAAKDIAVWRCGSQYVTSEADKHWTYPDPEGSGVIEWTRSFSFVDVKPNGNVKLGRLFFDNKNLTLYLDGKRCRELSREDWAKVFSHGLPE